jgi:hypothetical protein
LRGSGPKSIITICPAASRIEEGIGIQLCSIKNLGKQLFYSQAKEAEQQREQDELARLYVLRALAAARREIAGDAARIAELEHRPLPDNRPGN